MKIEQLPKEIAKRMPEERFAHVERVVQMAEKLANRHGVSEKRARVAAYLHDVAKFMDKEEMRALILRHGEDQGVLDYHHELWHAHAGAVVARTEFGIEDEGILDAIRYHTTGRAHMTSLEKIVYIADLVEEGRKFPGVETLRQLAETASLDDAMAASVRHTIAFLIEKRSLVYPASLDCYNEHMKKEGK